MVINKKVYKVEINRKTMVETGCGITGVTPSFPARDLLRVSHRRGHLVVSSHPFGPDIYLNNVGEMQKIYTHSDKCTRFSFREPTTSESISAATCYFGNVTKSQIPFSWGWLQLGWIVRASEGVFANPLKDAQGNPITDERVLKSFLNGFEKVRGIYLCKNDFGFAPYETFKIGDQRGGDFGRGGLARVLEHTEEEIAKNLVKISSFYEKGVDVSEFDQVQEPILTVASLCSDRVHDNYKLHVLGDNRLNQLRGYVFGVLNSGYADTKNLDLAI